MRTSSSSSISRSIVIDSSCECEHNNPDSLAARLFPIRGLSCRACCDHGRSIFSVNRLEHSEYED